MAVQEITSCHCKAIWLNTPNYIRCPSIILPHVAYMCSRSHKKTFNSQQLLWMDLFVDEHVCLPSSSSSSKTTTYHALWAREQKWRTNVSRTHPLCPFQVLVVFRTFCLTALDLYPISLLFSHSGEYKVVYFLCLIPMSPFGNWEEVSSFVEFFSSLLSSCLFLSICNRADTASQHAQSTIFALLDWTTKSQLDHVSGLSSGVCMLVVQVMSFAMIFICTN